MRLKSKTICLLLLFYALSSPRLSAQQASPPQSPPPAQTAQRDSAVRDSAYAVALREYHAFVNPDIELYRGPLYIEYAYTIKDGNPYFDESIIKGTIIYNGLLYTNIPLLYDEVQDNVVIKDPYEIWMIALDRDHVDSFAIPHHQFIRLSDTLNSSAPRPGFYEQLYRGDNLRLLRRESKTIQQQSSWQAISFEKYTVTSTSYYLKKGDTYHAVNNKGSLLSALKDRKADVRKFIRSNHLNIRKDKQNSLVKVITWYDGLTAR
jgi:hypothetical protein